MNQRFFPNVNDMADAVIAELKKTDDPFVSPVLVFHNTKIAQWFKAYYLKNNDEVLMNVRFETLSVFVNDIINARREHTIISASQIKNYIIKDLLENYRFDPSNAKNPINYIFDLNGKVNGINLYEFAGQLANLFMNYEYDDEDMTGKSWEAKLYDEVIELAKAENCYTTKSLFESVRSTGEIDAVRADLKVPVLIFDNSYMSSLYETLIDELNSSFVTVYTLEKEEPPYRCEEIFSAPSVMREVEAVHSKICGIIKDNLKVRFNDIMVYTPDIREYTNAIHQVFDQDDKNFLSVPYRIIGESSDQENMVKSLRILFDIANKRFFTRNDLNKFVKNPMIKSVWEITDEDVSAWMNMIVATHAYRNGKAKDDWDYLKKRLLLSKLVSEVSAVESKTEIAGENYLPYKSIDLSDESMNKLIDLIDVLSRWCNFFDRELNEICMDKASLDKMTETLDLLYSQKGTDGEETNYLYKPAYEQNERCKTLGYNLPANTWLLLLLDAPNRYVSHPADMFTNGVTFLSINIDDIVAEPYVFVMGLSSNLFPRIYITSEINYSQKHTANEILDEKSIRNICLGAGHCICSFVSRDLKKGSEHYPSPCMPSVPAGSIIRRIPLDEARDFDELYTQKEFADKLYHEGLVAGGTAAKPVKRAITPVSETETVLNLSDIKSYFDNTFVYKFRSLLNKGIYDVSEEDVCTAYEPLEASLLAASDVVKNIILCGDKEDDYREKTLLEKVLPEKEIGEMYYCDLLGKAHGVKEILEDEKYRRRRLEPLSLKTTVSGTAVEWILNCNVDMFFKEEGDTLYYFEPVLIKNDHIRYYFNAYVFSLMDIAQRNTDKEYTVWLNCVDDLHNKKFTMTSREATNILNRLYQYMTDYSDTGFMSSSIFNAVNEEDKLPHTFSELEKYCNDYDRTWGYFNDKKMVNVYEAFGYTDSNINARLRDIYRRLSACLKIL